MINLRTWFRITWKIGSKIWKLSITRTFPHHYFRTFEWYLFQLGDYFICQVQCFGWLQQGRESPAESKTPYSTKHHKYLTQTIRTLKIDKNHFLKRGENKIYDVIEKIPFTNFFISSHKYHFFRKRFFIFFRIER